MERYRKAGAVPVQGPLPWEPQGGCHGPALQSSRAGPWAVPPKTTRHAGTGHHGNTPPVGTAGRAPWPRRAILPHRSAVGSPKTARHTGTHSPIFYIAIPIPHFSPNRHGLRTMPVFVGSFFPSFFAKKEETTPFALQMFHVEHLQGTFYGKTPFLRVQAVL